MKFIFFFMTLFLWQEVFAQSETPENTDINLQGQVPRIEFDSTRFNFGDVYRGSTVAHDFTFENTGNGTLVLNSLHAACGCLNTKVFAKDGKTAQNIFKPNEAGVIHVEFDSSQFSGSVVRSVTAETNMGSSSPTVTLTLTANVLQELYATPSLLYIGRIDKNAEKNFSINLNFLQRARDEILNNSEPIKVFSVESTVPSIEAKLMPITVPNTQEIQVKVNSSLPIGPVNAKLIVWNNSTHYKNFQIPIVGEVVGRVDVSAKYVEFGVVSNAKTSERVITYSSSVKNFAITSVKINLRQVSEMKDLHDAEIFEIKKEKLSTRAGSHSDSTVAYRLHFKLIYPKKLNLPQSQEGSSGVNVSGNFLVKTNDPDYKEIAVPFFGVLRKEP
ncbi:MAG: DUF1573 domain-containing protein [Bdellovibrionota bacterium]